MRDGRITEAAPEFINRRNGLVLFRVSDPEQAARLPWFAANPPEMTAQYMPVYIVVKAKVPYAAVSTSHKVAQDASDKPMSPQIAQEIAPLFEPVKAEFEGEADSEFEYGFRALQQAILRGGGGGEFGQGGGGVGGVGGGQSQGGGGVALEEPPVEPAEGVPPSRLALGGPRPKTEPKGVNPLAGMRQMTGADVDSVISGARGEQDPAKAKSLRQQALSMMAQESKRRGKPRVQCWVEHLLR